MRCNTQSLCIEFIMQRGHDSLVQLPTNHPYYAQMQSEMASLNVEWCCVQ